MSLFRVIKRLLFGKKKHKKHKKHHKHKEHHRPPPPTPEQLAEQERATLKRAEAQTATQQRAAEERAEYLEAERRRHLAEQRAKKRAAAAAEKEAAAAKQASRDAYLSKLAEIEQREPTASPEPVHPSPQPTPAPSDEPSAIQLEYHDMDWLERQEQELAKHKRTNRDAATDAAAAYHHLHQDDGTHESGLDPDSLTDIEREQLRYNGGADSQYWNA